MNSAIHAAQALYPLCQLLTRCLERPLVQHNVLALIQLIAELKILLTRPRE